MFNQIDIHGCTTIEAKIRLDKTCWSAHLNNECRRNDHSIKIRSFYGKILSNNVI